MRGLPSTSPRCQGPGLPCRRRATAAWRAGAGGQGAHHRQQPVTRGSVKASAHSAPAEARPLDASRSLAWARLQESRQPEPLLQDPYAEALTQTSPPGAADPPAQQAAMDIIATKYIDECLLNAANAVNINRINKGDYRQVVLVGDGMDTRPYRLLWPEGTVIFLLAPSESHELAEAVLRQAGARVPRGCLLRRVNADLQRCGSFGAELQRAGFRGERLSVWAFQGLSGLRLGLGEVTSVLTEATNNAAYHSLLLGELPPMTRRQGDNLLADLGLLGAMLPYGADAADYGRWRQAQQNGLDAGGAGVARGCCASAAEEAGSAVREGGVGADGASMSHAGGDDGGGLGGDDDGAAQRWLFTSQQMRLSVAEMDTYAAHRGAAEDLDEDFFGNFS